MPASLQTTPDAAAWSPWSPERARAIIAAHQHRRGALLPMLHALQETFGCIDAAAVPLLAEALNLSPAEVHGVVSFYHDFRRTRPGRHVLKVCRGEACQAVGAEALMAHAMTHLHTEAAGTASGTSGDGLFTLEAVFCLGNCALGPSVMIDGAVLGRVDPPAFDALVAERRAAAAATEAA